MPLNGQFSMDQKGKLAQRAEPLSKCELNYSCCFLGPGYRALYSFYFFNQ